MLKRSPSPAKVDEPKPTTVLARAWSASAKVPSASVPLPEATTAKVWRDLSVEVVETGTVLVGDPDGL